MYRFSDGEEEIDEMMLTRLYFGNNVSSYYCDYNDNINNKVNLSF